MDRLFHLGSCGGCVPRSGNPEDFLPLSAPAFHILLVLGAGPLHPYGVMQAIDRRTGGRATVLPGTLYTSIARLRQQGLVEDAPGGTGAGEDERRRYYRLTRLGRAVAAAEADRLAVLVDLARGQGLIPSAPGSRSAGEL